MHGSMNHYIQSSRDRIGDLSVGEEFYLLPFSTVPDPKNVVLAQAFLWLRDWQSSGRHDRSMPYRCNLRKLCSGFRWRNGPPYSIASFQIYCTKVREGQRHESPRSVLLSLWLICLHIIPMILLQHTVLAVKCFVERHQEHTDTRIWKWRWIIANWGVNWWGELVTGAKILGGVVISKFVLAFLY